MKNFILILHFLLFIACKKNTETCPTVSTSDVLNITSTTASCGGNISSDGGSAVISRGVCWSTSQSPTINSNKTNEINDSKSFTITVTGLNANTTYYVRAYATNSVGTGYGSTLSFKTQQLVSETVTDIDGNIYHTVTIGTQTWMVENLRVTKFTDGTNIPNVTDNQAWGALTTPGYCWYNNNFSTYGQDYGALYNWYTVNVGNLCPIGWHVPTDNDWSILISYLGGENTAGGSLKESGVAHWLSPNTGANNNSSFTALPGGYRSTDGTFIGVGVFDAINMGGGWWSSSENDLINAWGRTIYYNASSINRVTNIKSVGFSVRCLRNN